MAKANKFLRKSFLLMRWKKKISSNKRPMNNWWRKLISKSMTCARRSLNCKIVFRRLSKRSIIGSPQSTWSSKTFHNKSQPRKANLIYSRMLKSQSLNSTRKQRKSNKTSRESRQISQQCKDTLNSQVCQHQMIKV